MVLPIDKFLSLVLSRNANILQHLIKFPLYYLQVVAYGRLKIKENFKHVALKVATVV